jgi:hypothetical protein
MSEEDSGSMPSDNDSQDLPPPPRRGWYLADLGATDASWNLARTETKKVFQGVMVVGRRCAAYSCLTSDR